MLSKSDKNKYRSLLFRHIDGISLIGPISQLNKSNLTNFINDNDSFVLEDITSTKKCNSGYINVTLHLLRCQGWLHLEKDTYSKTNDGKEAMSLLHFYEKIYNNINDLIQCNKTLFDKNNTNDYLYEILSVIKN